VPFAGIFHDYKWIRTEPDACFPDFQRIPGDTCLHPFADAPFLENGLVLAKVFLLLQPEILGHAGQFIHCIHTRRKEAAKKGVPVNYGTP
jgi:hypothetical protein